MRRLALFALALSLGAPACNDDNPVGPSSSGPIVFTAELRASNEVPAIGNAELTILSRDGDRWSVAEPMMPDEEVPQPG